MGKNMQLNEWIVWFGLFAVAIEIGMFVSHQLTQELLTALIGFMIGGGCLVPLAILWYARRYSKKVFYNPISEKVELHIGRTNSPMKFARTVLETVKVARQLDTTVLFYTNHYSKEELEKRWNKGLTIQKANILQRISFYIPYFILTFGMKTGTRHPLLKCHLNPKQFHIGNKMEQ